ncbi:MAG TPA: 4Fe-4S binding protein [Methanocella sp.]|nr:4Fe-4S binding protein [Methanocella sp.]
MAGANVTTISLDIQNRTCTGCNNCVVACPVNALELTVANPATKKKTYNVLNGKAVVVDEEVCNGCGVCLEVCPQSAITLTTE